MASPISRACNAQAWSQRAQLLLAWSSSTFNSFILRTDCIFIPLLHPHTYWLVTLSMNEIPWWNLLFKLQFLSCWLFICLPLFSRFSFYKCRQHLILIETFYENVQTIFIDNFFMFLYLLEKKRWLAHCLLSIYNRSHTLKSGSVEWSGGVAPITLPLIWWTKVVSFFFSGGNVGDLQKI